MVQISRHLLSRKAAYALIAVVTISVILLSAFTFTSHWGNPAIENQAVNVEITDFYFTEPWNCVGGLAFVAQFNLTLKNYGSTDVGNLVLKVKMFDNGTDVGVGNYFFNYTYENGTVINPIKKNETKEYSGVLSDDILVVAFPANTTITRYYEASVILNGNILDEKRIDG
jgi:hypothetical protein